MKREITFENIHCCRSPREGELNFELKRIILEHAVKRGSTMFDAVKGVNIALSRLVRSKKFNIKDFEVKYHRTSDDVNGSKRAWVTESVMVVAHRRRSNRTVATHIACAFAYPRRMRKDHRSATLTAPRSINVSCSINDPYM